MIRGLIPCDTLEVRMTSLDLLGGEQDRESLLISTGPWTQPRCAHVLLVPSLPWSDWRNESICIGKCQHCIRSAYVLTQRLR